jgi:hypothetical protein
MEKTILTICNYCDGDKHHNRLFVTKGRVLNEGDENDYEVITYMVLECCGCKMISFVSKVKNRRPLPGEPSYIVKHFYHHMDEDQDKFSLLRDKDYDKLPAKIQDLYDEVTFAFEQGMQVSAATGLRTLVETVCNNQKIAGKNLQEKIKALHARGLISTSELPILDKLRLIGNQSTHEAKAFSVAKLSYALDIINHILVSIYVLPKINKRLKVM